MHPALLIGWFKKKKKPYLVCWKIREITELIKIKLKITEFDL